MARRDHDEPERYPDYSDYLNGQLWPSYDANEGVTMRYIDEMPPQYAAAARAKLKRWAMAQYGTQVDAERYWAEVSMSTLGKMLGARAQSEDDFSIAVESQAGLNTQQAIHLIARSMLEGAGDEEDPMDIAMKSTRAVTNVYNKGFVIMRRNR